MKFPICSTCNRAYKPFQNGVDVLEMAGDRPYKLWAADSLRCPICGNVIISGFSTRAFEHFEQGFVNLLKESYVRGLLVMERDSLTPTNLTLADVMAKLTD